MRKKVYWSILILLLICFESTKLSAQNTLTIKLQSGSKDTICNNFSSVSFEIVKEPNCASPTFQWYVNDSLVVGQNGKQYSSNNFKNGDLVTCRQTNNISPCIAETSNAIKIVIKPNQSITWVNASGSLNQTVCQFKSIIPIRFQIIGATNAIATGLPQGVSGSFSNGVFTIAGNPSISGTFNFQIQTTGTDLCGSTAQMSGVLTVNNAASASLVEAGQTSSIVFNGLNYFVRCSNVNNANISLSNNTQNVSAATSYKISWGDNTPDTVFTNFTSTIIHNYVRGFYQLTFTVLSGNNCSSPATYGIFVGNSPKGTIGNLGNLSGCGPMKITFPITDTAGNVPGTIYNIDFGDGKDTTFIHPNIPSAIEHVYDKSSCGFNSNTISPNTFTAAMTVSNPCFPFAKSTIGPIVLSLPSEPKIDIDKTIACIGELVQATDNSKNGVVISLNGCNTISSRYWTISPTSGYTTNNSLGSNGNNPNDIDFWTNGDKQLNLRFTQTGNYDITLYNANTCNLNNLVPITKKVCINPLPKASFTVQRDSICAGESLSFTNTSNLPFCGSRIFRWSISFTNLNGCSAAVAPIFVNNTNISSENPVIRFTAPGIYEISLQTSFDSQSCQSAVFKTKVYVLDKPNVNLFVSKQSLCAGDTLNPIASINCNVNNATISWEFTNATPTNSNNLNPGSIAFNNLGTSSIKLAVTNACGTTNLAQAISISFPPTITIPTNKTVCAGSNTGNLSFTSNGSNINWIVDKANIGIPGNALTGSNSLNSFVAVNTTNNAIIAKFIVSATNTGCVKRDSFNLTIYPKPVSPNTNSAVTYCQNAVAMPLTATPANGHTLLWYTTPTGGEPATIAPIPSTTTPGNTVYYVSQTNSNTNCESGRTPITVTVNASPTISSSSSNNTNRCGTATGSIVLNGLLNNNTYLVNYEFGGRTITNNYTASAAGVLTIGNLAAGTYSNITVTSNNCTSSPVGPFTISDPNPPATPIVGNVAPLCSGNTLNLSASSNTNNVIFSWSGPSNFTSTSANPIRNNVTVGMSGTYSVTTSLAGCTSPAATVNVMINQTPAMPTASSNSPVCIGNSLNLLANSVTPGVNYVWTGPNNFNSTEQNPVVPAVTNAVSGDYIVTADNGFCTSPSRTISVVIKPTPNIADAVKTDPTACATSTGSITLSGLTSGQQYLVNFEKGGIVQPSQTITASGGNVVLAGLTAGTYTNISVTLNGCPSNIIAGPFTLVDPNPPATPTIAAINAVCSGKPLTLNVVNPDETLIYNWRVQGGIFGTGTSFTINKTTMANNGTALVTATLNGCVSAAGTVVVVVDSTPVAPTITSNAPLCFGSNLNFTASTTFPGALTYAWTGPNNFTSTLQNPTIENATELASGSYSLTITATAGNCSPGAITKQVIVRPLITQAQIQAADTLVVCNFNPPANASQNIMANLNANRSFETGKWSIITQPNGSSAGFGNEDVPNTSFTYDKSGIYAIKWTVSNNLNCPSTNDTLVLSIIDQPQIKQPLTATALNVCAGNPVTISVPANQVIGDIIKWQYKRPYTNNIWLDTLVTNNAITFNNIQDTFSVRLVVIAKNQVECSGDTAFREIKINVAPPSFPGTTRGEDTVCAGNNSGTIQLTGNIGTPIWQLSTDGIIFSDIPNSALQNLSYTNLSVTTWFRAAVKSGVCDTVFSNATKITVYPLVTQANAGVDAELCGANSYQLNGNKPGNLENGVWIFAAGSPTATIVNPNLPNTSINNLVPNTNYQLIWTLSNGVCPASNDELIIRNYAPLVNTIDTTTITVCNKVVVNITGNQPIGGNSPYLYQWQQLHGNSWIDIPGANSISYSFTADTTVKIRRLVTAIPCSNASIEKTVFVQPPLANNHISGSSETCINNSPGMLTGSLPIGADGIYFYQWQVFNGTNWLDIPNATQKDFLVPVLEKTTAYRRLVTSALCSGNQGIYSDAFEVIVRPNAAAKWIISKDTSCAPFSINKNIVRPQNQNFENKQYHWYANNILYGADSVTNPGYTLVNPGDSVLIKMVAISRFSCKNDSINAWFFTPPKPITSFIPSDTVKCGPATISFVNTTNNIQYFTYFWNFGNGKTYTGVTPPPVVFQTNPTYADTVYKVTLTAFSACDTISFSKSIRIKSKPKSLFAPSKTIGCSPMTVEFVNSTKGLNVTYKWLFGDGTELVTTKPDTVKHVYNSGMQDTVYASLIATNECGTDTSQFAIVITPRTVNVDVAINGNQTIGCSPHIVQFINRSNGATNFNWDFGDGNILNTTHNIDTVVHLYQRPGSYQVKIRATNNCTDTTDIENVRVFASPNANFVATPISVCVGDSILFTNQTDTATGYLWHFNNGNISTLTNPWQQFTKAGTYNVSLIATRQYGPGNACSDTIQKAINVTASLPGLFLVTDSVSSCVPFTVTFRNQNLPSSLTIWDFGDGVKDTGNIVTHTYSKLGVYKATMMATNTGGCNFLHEKQITVNGPAATWRYDKGFVCGNNPVRFEVTAQNTDSILYDFGDGKKLITNQRVVFHQYANSGNYIPSITLFNGKNCVLPLVGTDTIKVDYVQAGFKWVSNAACNITQLAFTDTSRAFNGLKRWEWSLGDNTTQTVPNLTHSYTATGTYKIRLIAFGNSGCSDTTETSINIKVNKSPLALIFADTVGCVGQPVNYKANIVSDDSLVIANWQFSNGLTINGTAVNNLYSTTGSYTVRFVTGTAFGCFDTANASITIHPTPRTVVNPDLLICSGQQVQLTANGANNYVWQPINGSLSCTNCANPIAAPLTTTQYIVTGTNLFGCSSKDTVLVTVAQPIKIRVEGKDTICIGDRTTLTAFGATTYQWSPATALSNTNTPSVVANPAVTTQYRLIGFDAHNCFQDTLNITVAVGQYPIIQLGDDKTLATGTILPLKYTVVNGPLSTHLWSPLRDIDCATCPDPNATIKKNICYTLTAQNQYKCAATDTICIKVFCENTQVYIPNVFTPDGDGVNDVLMVRGSGIKTVKSFRIFNRWGQIVFERGNITPNVPSMGWDGKVKGVPAAPDVYVYTCEVVCEDDTVYTYKGNVAIVK